jgi:hypothetical protein
MPNQCYHVVHCNLEAAAVARDLKTILEAELATTFPSDLVVLVGIQNASANQLFVQSQPGVVLDAISIAAGGFKQIGPAGAFRIPLREVFVRVSVNADPFIVEILFE